MEKGKLIVLEGIDGSGKSAQYRRICEKLKRDGIEYNHIVFPRYDKDSSALIRMYLSGEFGEHPEDVNAYTASTFFAVDRFASFKQDWGEKYRAGAFILSDRYTSSNAVHQGSKLPDGELHDYFAWLADLEYAKMGLPRPDLVIYLDVSIELSLARMRRRQLKTNTHADIHEKDIAYLEKCLHTADKAADFFGWHRVAFLKDGQERNIDEKNEEIYQLILSELNK
jgi:dTMP kinase